MSFRVLYAAVALLAAQVVSAQALDPANYALTSGAAEQFVGATQSMVASGGSGPQVQGDGMDLARVKESLERDPAAQKALASVGMSSTDYALFLGAAMQAMAVGQMEMAGMRGVLPPGVTERPSQQNIDFMKANMDLFTRAMTPGASATASAGAADGGGAELPVPSDAGAVLPSTILARIPAVNSIEAAADCSLAELSATIDRETARARALESAYYGNPGDRGLASSAAEGEVLERAGDTELVLCGQLANFIEPPDGPMSRADQEKKAAFDAIGEEERAAWTACPGIPGGKEPECERRVEAEAAAARDAAERRYLTAVSPPFAAMLERMRACSLKREAIVQDAKAADVRGADVQDVLRPLVAAWELPAAAVSQWRAICASAQNNLIAR